MNFQNVMKEIRGERAEQQLTTIFTQLKVGVQFTRQFSGHSNRLPNMTLQHHDRPLLSPHFELPRPFTSILLIAIR